MMKAADVRNGYDSAAVERFDLAWDRHVEAVSEGSGVDRLAGMSTTNHTWSETECCP